MHGIGGETIPIQWNVDAVREALDEVEVLVQETLPKLDSAINVTKGAQAIPNLPQYMIRGLHEVEELILSFERVLQRDLQTLRERVPTPQRRAQNGKLGPPRNL